MDCWKLGSVYAGGQGSAHADQPKGSPELADSRTVTSLREILLAERRRHERHAIELPVVFHWNGPQEGSTHDVSYGGAFLRTRVHPPLGQLIRVEFPRLPGRPPMVIQAVVARVTAHAGVDERPQGIGLALFGVGREAEDAWRALVDDLTAVAAGSGSGEELLTLADEAPPVRRTAG